MRVPIAILAFLPLAVFAPGAWGIDPERPFREYTHEVWHAKSGLPQHSIWALAQTSDGFLWIGALAGLSRYNGFTFDLFDENNTPGFPHNHVGALLAASDGSLWIGSYDGLVRYKDGVFQPFGREQGLRHTVVRSLAEDPGGGLWIATNGGVYRFSGGKFVLYEAVLGEGRTARSSAAQIVLRVLVSRAGRVWAGTEGGLLRLAGDKLVPFGGALCSRPVPALAETPGGTVWAGSAAGLIRIRGDRAALAGYAVRDVQVLATDRSGTLWIGARRGLARLTSRGFEFLGAAGMPDASVISIHEDFEGSLWVGTESGGLSRFSDRSLRTLTEKDGLVSPYAKSVCEDAGGAIWIGTEHGGLGRYANRRVEMLTVADGLLSNTVRSVWPGAGRRLWIGTFAGLNWWRDGRLYRASAGGRPFHHGVEALLETAEGELWVATHHSGAARISRDGRLRFFTTRDGLASDRIKAIAAARDGAIWFGSFDRGLSRLQNNQFRSFTVRDGLSNNRVRSLHAEEDGTLWIGTLGGGLNRLRDGRFTVYRAPDGLFDDTVLHILPDSSGQHLWMTSYRGIFRAAKKELDDFAAGAARRITSISFETSDGSRSLLSSGNTQPAGWRGADGRLWFPLRNGVAVIDPAQVRTNTVPPPVVLERVSINRQEVKPRSPLRLPLGAGELEFQYIGLSLLQPHKVRYRYRLEGLDSDWIEAGERRIAHYRNVPPGRYRFQVTAANNDGVWNTGGAAVEFQLTPPFWRTPWFPALAAGLLLVAILQAYRRRVARVKASYETVLAERARIARELHDTLLQGLAGIAFSLKGVLTRLPGDAAGAITQLERVLARTNQCMTEARQSVWGLRSGVSDEQPFAGTLGEIARQFDNGTIAIEVSVGGEQFPLPSEVRENLRRITAEALANAVRHAGARHIRLELSYGDRNVLLSVKDDGHGFDERVADGKAGHFGLVGMRERAANIGAQFRIRSGREGTEVLVVAPVK